MLSVSLWFHGIANVSYNLSAAWFAVAFVAPAYIQKSDWFFILTKNITLGIVLLVVGILLETVAKNYDKS